MSIDSFPTNRIFLNKFRTLFQFADLPRAQTATLNKLEVMNENALNPERENDRIDFWFNRW